MVNELVKDLDRERCRQRMTKAQLAKKAGLPPESVRRLFTRDMDVKLSTYAKLAQVLCARVALDKVDSGLTTEQSGYLLGRIGRRHRAEQIAERKKLDPGDVEHALYNLTLTPTQRLMRSMQRAKAYRSRRPAKR